MGGQSSLHSDDWDVVDDSDSKSVAFGKLSLSFSHSSLANPLIFNLFSPDDDAALVKFIFNDLRARRLREKQARERAMPDDPNNPTETMAETLRWIASYQESSTADPGDATQTVPTLRAEPMQESSTADPGDPTQTVPTLRAKWLLRELLNPPFPPKGIRYGWAEEEQDRRFYDHIAHQDEKIVEFPVGNLGHQIILLKHNKLIAVEAKTQAQTQTECLDDINIAQIKQNFKTPEARERELERQVALFYEPLEGESNCIDEMLPGWRQSKFDKLRQYL